MVNNHIALSSHLHEHLTKNIRIQFFDRTWHYLRVNLVANINRPLMGQQYDQLQVQLLAHLREKKRF